jgi:outer membrane protein OmpA-like peptidoglycan-associated protein
MKYLFIAFSLLFSHYSVGQTTLKPTEYDAVVVFKITDDKMVPEEGAVVRLENLADKTVLIDTADIDGNSEFLLKKGSSHILTVEKLSMKFEFGQFDIPKKDGKFEMEENLQIKVITQYKRTYRLDVHFAPNRSDLYPAAKKEVDNLLKEMQKNPTMKVEVGGHTDNVGDDKLNMQVSQRRANAIKSYLVEQGVAEKRIVAKGYGETAPVGDNATEDGRNRNRRIEIRMF